MFLMHDVIFKMDFFQGTHNRFLSLIASKMVPEHVTPGHDICQQGDDADRLWVLQEGVQLHRQSSNLL